MGVSPDQRGSFIDSIQRFGQRNSSVTSFALIWQVSNRALPDYLNVASPQKIVAISTDASDTASGTGMRAVKTVGVVSGFAQESEIIWMNGTSPSTGTLDKIRVNRTFGLFCGTAGTNVGTISIGYGVTSTNGTIENVLAMISPGQGQTEQMTISIPNSVEIHIHNFTCMTGRTGGGQDVLSDFRLRSRDIQVNPDGSANEIGPWRVRFVGPTISDIDIDTEGDSFIVKGPADIVFEAQGSAAGARQAVNLIYEEHKSFQNPNDNTA